MDEGLQGKNQPDPPKISLGMVNANATYEKNNNKFLRDKIQDN